jgi:hypothetical protein
VVLEVAAPIVLAHDSGAAVFSRAAALELCSEVGRGEACRCRRAPTVGVCTTIVVHDNAGDGSRDPWEWCARFHPWGGMLIAATTRWSMSLHHCSAATSEASGPGGL